MALGFDAISQSAISEAQGVVGSAATITGAAVVAGAGRNIGTAKAAGTIIGAGSVRGATRSFGGVGVPGTQAFDFSVNAIQALVWQYNTAPNLTALLKAKQAWYEVAQTAFWEDWINDVFDLRTANDFGCAVWSIILRLPLAIEYAPGDGENWGFDPYANNFDRGNFFPRTLVPLPLTLSQKRIALQLRYFQLITRGCIPQINSMLKRIFGQYGTAWVVDNLDMSITYCFDFQLPDPLQFIINFYDLLPRPAGVSANYVMNVITSAGTVTAGATVHGAT